MPRKKSVPPQLREWVYGRRKTRSKRRTYYKRDPGPSIGLRRRLVNPLIKMVSPLIGTGTAIQQMTEKDVQEAINQGVWQNYTGQDKVLYIVHNILRRTTGWTPFTDKFGATTGPTINPWGWANKWTGLGVVFKLMNLIPKMPGKVWFNRAGNGMIPGGVVGGIFDPPRMQTITYNPTITKQGSMYGYVTVRT